MSDFRRLDPEKFPDVDAALCGMGIDIGQAMTDPRVSAYADGLFRIASNPTDMDAVNTTLRAHESMGYLLPGFFQTTPDSMNLFREGE